MTPFNTYSPMDGRRTTMQDLPEDRSGLGFEIYKPILAFEELYKVTKTE
jgi:hypothetical protein